MIVQAYFFFWEERWQISFFNVLLKKELLTKSLPILVEVIYIEEEIFPLLLFG